MANADASLDILIRTKAELAGAKAAESAIEQQIGKAKALGKEYSGLSAKLEQVRSSIKEYEGAVKDEGAELNSLSPKTQEYVRNLLEEDQAAGKVAFTHRQLTTITRSLTRAFPELAQVVKQLANPWVGLAIAVGAAANSARKETAELNELVNRAGPDWGTYSDAIKAVDQAYTDASVSSEKFAREMERLQRAQRTPQELAEQASVKLKEQTRAETELLEAQKNRLAAGIDLAEKTGVMSHADAVAAKLAIDEQYAKRRLEIEERIRQGEFKIKFNELATALGKEGAASGALPGAEHNAATAKAAADKNAEQLKTNREDLEKAIKERAELQAAISEATEIVHHKSSADVGKKIANMLGFKNLSADEALELLERRSLANEASIASFKKLIGKGKTAGTQLQAEADRASEDLEELRGRIRALKTLINQLKVEVPALKERNEAATGTSGKVGGLESGARAAGAVGSLGEDLKAGEVAANALTHGQRISKEQSQLLQSLVGVLSASGHNQAESIKLLSDGLTTMKSHALLIQELQRGYQQLKGQVGTLKNPFG